MPEIRPDVLSASLDKEIVGHLGDAVALGLLRRLSSAYALAILLEDMRRRELVPELGDLRLITPATGDLPPGFDEDWDRGTAKTTGATCDDDGFRFHSVKAEETA